MKLFYPGLKDYFVSNRVFFQDKNGIEFSGNIACSLEGKSFSIVKQEDIVNELINIFRQLFLSMTVIKVIESRVSLQEAVIKEINNFLKKKNCKVTNISLIKLDDIDEHGAIKKYQKGIVAGMTLQGFNKSGANASELAEKIANMLVANPLNNEGYELPSAT